MLTSRKELALVLVLASVLPVVTLLATDSPVAKSNPGPEAEKAVLSRLADIQKAAEGLDPEKVFSFVLENNKGALVQNGKVYLSRQDALDSTRQGFQTLKKVEYKFDQQQVSFLTSTTALVVGDGATTVELQDGRTFTRRFAQSVVLVSTNGEWKVFHSHRSFPPAP